ncbi:MAG: ClpXP protease specificity-enhancing factor SspB [Hyphomicrobiaceae bacterium]
MSGEDIDYESLTQQALRGVVRQILTDVAADGLPGNHHFYVAFNTQAEGVGISKRLKEQYPEEMTIVLQHRFWDLAVHDDRFEVKLTFNSIPERLVVPFTAIKVFFDPSVPYGLQFEAGGSDQAARRQPHLTEIVPPADPRSSKPLGEVSSIERVTARETSRAPQQTEAVQVSAGAETRGDDEILEAEKPSAEVVSLDKFRKK